jgi:formylglycine-generating enzyme required for sulfatase activity
VPVEGPTPVGLFWAGNSRRFGLWDLAGNVSEYCRDGFAPYDTTITTDPLGDDYSYGAVIRGGHFRSSGLDLRITARFGVDRGEQLETAGFRCAAVRNSMGGND